jgi:exonuclease VII large subunit
MIISRPQGDTTIVRPVQVKGKYATDEMVLAIPYFVSRSRQAPVLIAWMQRGSISPAWGCASDPSL